MQISLSQIEKCISCARSIMQAYKIIFALEPYKIDNGKKKDFVSSLAVSSPPFDAIFSLVSQVFLKLVWNFYFCFFSFIWWDTFCLLSRVVTPLLPYFFAWRLFTCVNFSMVCIISFPFLFLLFFITLMIPYLFQFWIFYLLFTQVVLASHIFVNQFVSKEGRGISYVF